MNDFKQKSVVIKFTFYNDHSAYTKNMVWMGKTGRVKEAIKPSS